MSSSTIRCSLSSTTRSGGFFTDFADLLGLTFIFQLDHAMITAVNTR
jgi:hypothetical protein